MCMNVTMCPEEMDVFQEIKLFSHQAAYPGGTQYFLSGAKWKSPSGKTHHPVQCEASTSKGQTDKKKLSQLNENFLPDSALTPCVL